MIAKLLYIKKFDRLKNLLNSNTSILFTEFKISEKIKNFLNSKFKCLKPVKLYEYPDSIFYFNTNKEYIFEITKDNILYIRNKDLWEFLEEKYSIDHENIKELVTEFVKSQYKLNVDSTFRFSSYPINLVEEYYKNLLIGE